MIVTPQTPIGVQFGKGKKALQTYRAMKKQFFLNKPPGTGTRKHLFDTHFKRYFMGLMNSMRQKRDRQSRYSLAPLGIIYCL